MRALIIVLSVLAALFLLLLAGLHITLTYNGRLSLRIRYLFLCFTLYPTKKRKRKKGKKKKKRSTPGNPHSKESAPKSSRVKNSKKKKKRLSLGDIRFLLKLLHEVLGQILDKASRHVRIIVRRLHITVGGERDAARAAIEYGIISQSASYFLAYLDQTGFLRTPKADAIGIRINFTEREHSLNASIDVVCPLLFLIPLLFSALTHFFTAKARWSRRRASTAHSASTNPQNKENQNG